MPGPGAPIEPGANMPGMRPLLLTLAACAFASAAAAQAIDWSKAETVTVVTTEYHFTPETLTFKHGVPYRLHVENPGKEMHEVTATDFFKAVTIRNPDVLARGAPEIVVQPGEQKDLFFVAERAGHYKLTCADHDWAGMVGEIVIQ